MAGIAQYGALSLILDHFKHHQAQYFGSTSHGYIRLFVKDQLAMESNNPHDLLSEIAKELGTREICLCEYNGNRSKLVSKRVQNNKRVLELEWSVKDQNGNYQIKTDLQEMNAGTQLFFGDSRSVQLLKLLSEHKKQAFAQAA